MICDLPERMLEKGIIYEMERQYKELEEKVQSLKFILNKSMMWSLSKTIEAISRHEALIMSRIKGMCELKKSVVDPKLRKPSKKSEPRRELN